jgi:hypothetical protein
MRNQRIRFGFAVAMVPLVLIIASSSFVQIGFGASPQVTAAAAASKVGAASRSSVNYPANGTSSGPPPPGSLPVMSFYNSTANKFQQPSGPGSAPVTSAPYVGAEGYQTHGSYTNIMAAYTGIILTGGPSYLGSSTVSGGLNLHVPDSTYSIDYIVELYAYFSSASYASVSWAVYSACYDTGHGCGPAYNNCTYPNCPVTDVLISSGSDQNIGLAGDNIELLVRWDNTYGWVLDYRDQANNPSYWTVVTVFPSGTYSTMRSWSEVGEIASAYNAPVYEAYAFQVGFVMSSIPVNPNWVMNAVNTQYELTGGSSFTYLDHAQTTEFCYVLSCSTPGYWDFWKGIWVVSDTAAEHQGISASGSGNGSSNNFYILFGGTSQGAGGGVQLW